MTHEQFVREYLKLRYGALARDLVEAVFVRLPLHALLVWLVWGIAQSLHRIAEAAEFSAGLMP